VPLNAARTDDSAFRACCFHVRTCTLSIGIFELICIILQMISVGCTYWIADGIILPQNSTTIFTSQPTTSTTTGHPLTTLNTSVATTFTTTGKGTVTIPHLNQLANATTSQNETTITTTSLTTGHSLLTTEPATWMTTTPLPSNPGRILWVSVMTLLVGFPIVVLLIVGVLKERHLFLIPHLVCQVIWLAVMMGFIIAYGTFIRKVNELLALATEQVSKWGAPGLPHLSDTGVLTLSGFLIFLLLVMFLVDVYFFVVVLRCYRYLKFKQGFTGDVYNRFF